MGADSIKVLYDFTKCDQEGEKVSWKNLYANPFDGKQCIFVGLGCYLSLCREQLERSESHFFFLQGGKIGSAASRYCDGLLKLLDKFRDTASQYCRVNRTHSHGNRKGAGMHATSGTTAPPPLSSVAHRGEWSQGTVYDIYLLFAEPGDHYLGRILAGLDPNSANFAVLPDTFGQNVRFSRRLSVEAWGQYARAHIWNSIKNQMVNFLDTAILKLRYELIDTTPVV
jgi:hypothetical protein